MKTLLMSIRHSGVLLLFLHDADDFVRNAGQIDGSRCRRNGERLLLRVGARKATRGSASCPRQCKSVLAHGDAADFRKRRSRAGDGDRSRVEVCWWTGIFPALARAGVLYNQANPARVSGYRVLPTDPPSALSHSCRLVLPAKTIITSCQSLSLLSAALAGALARCHHHHNGDRFPSDAEHSQRRPQLCESRVWMVVFNEVGKRKVSLPESYILG